MQKKYLCLALLIAFAALFQGLWRLIYDPGEPSWRQSGSSTPSANPPDAETKLAYGERLSLAGSGTFELELIKGISDEHAQGLLTHRPEILKRAMDLEPEEQHKALEVVHGIGPKKSRKFIAQLDLTPEEQGSAARDDWQQLEKPN